jgi:hypothetical protein
MYDATLRGADNGEGEDEAIGSAPTAVAEPITSLHRKDGRDITSANRRCTQH